MKNFDWSKVTTKQLCDSRNYERQALREARKALRDVQALRKELGL